MVHAAIVSISADHKLNLIYEELKTKVEKNLCSKIQKSQKAWLKFRDFESEAFASLSGDDGSSAYNIGLISNKTVMTLERIKELKIFFEVSN